MKYLFFGLVFFALTVTISACTSGSNGATATQTEVTCDSLQTRTDSLNSKRFDRSYSNSQFLAECQFIQRQNGLKCDDTHAFDFTPERGSCEQWVASVTALRPQYLYLL
jgi:hypothetical protein